MEGEDATPEPSEATITSHKLVNIRIRYKDLAVCDTRVTTIAVDSEHATVRDAVDVACQKFGITKPEMYGFAYSTSGAPPKPSSSGSTSPRANTAPSPNKKSFRDETEWIPEVRTITQAGLQEQDEVELKLRHPISAGPHALRIMIPSENKDVVVKYTYTTTVSDLITAVLQNLAHDKLQFKKNAVDKWKIFLPIVSTTEGIWLVDNRTIDSYDMYSGYPEKTTPTMNIPAESLRLVLLCRRVEDRDAISLSSGYFKNPKEIRWLQRMDEIESMKKKDEAKLRELVRQGLPQSLRGAIWARITGTLNHPQTRPSQYLRYLYDPIPEASLQAIRMDIPRTFPAHPFFAEGSQGPQSLENVLRALANKFPDIGYCQGQNFIAGICLLNMEEEQAFWLMDYIMTRWNWQGFFAHGMSLVSSVAVQMKLVTASSVPEVHKHLAKLDVPYGVFCSTWFSTIFTYDAPLPFVLRLWDIFLLEGPVILFRVIMGIFKTEQQRLLQLGWEKLILFLKETPQRLYDVESVFQAALKIKKLKVMERIYTMQELEEIQNGHSVPKSPRGKQQPESSSPPGGLGAIASDNQPSLFRRVSQSLLGKKPSSPGLNSPNSASATPKSRARSRSRSFGDEDSPADASDVSTSPSISPSSSSEDLRASLVAPNPYLFGTPYYRKPQNALAIIDSAPNGRAVLSFSTVEIPQRNAQSLESPKPPTSPTRPLFSAVSLPNFDPASLEKARAAVAAQQRSQEAPATDSITKSQTTLALRSPRSPRSPLTLALPKIDEEYLEPAPGGLAKSRSAPSSPRKPAVDRSEVQSAIADMLEVAGPDFANKDETARERQASSPKKVEKRGDSVSSNTDPEVYQDYLAASMLLDESSRPEVRT